MDRRALDEIVRLVRPLAMRVANLAARAVVQLVDDAKKLQMLQIGVLQFDDDSPEDVDDAEHHQPYGFSSVPLEGAEAVVIFPNSDRSHPLVVSVSDRRHRPTGGAPGEVTMYNSDGTKIVLRGADVEITPGPGGKVIAAGADTTTEGVVVGSGIDPFTGSPYTALGNASSKVFAKK
jgi:phage baseplate assembly protein V